MEQALGQPRLPEHRLEHRAAAHGRLRVGLEDDGVPDGQRRARRSACPSTDGRVPGRDRADDAGRDAPEHRQAPGHDARDQLAVGLERHRRGRVELAGREVGLVEHLAVDRAGLALGPRPELGTVGLVDVRRPAEDRRALGVARVGPRGLRRGGRGGGPGDIVGRGLRQRQQRPAARGLADLARRAGAGAPVGQERVEPAGRLGCRVLRRRRGHRVLLRPPRPRRSAPRRSGVRSGRSRAARSRDRARPGRGPGRRRSGRPRGRRGIPTTGS